MRAFVMTGYGGPEKTEIRDVPAPVAGAGELLVRVRAAGLNPVDFKTRQGGLRVIRGYAMPQIMGNELAGVVESVGAGVTRFSPGDKVFARVDKDRLGAFAELAIVREEHAAAMPTSLDFEKAAGVPLAALTALQALRDELAMGPGKKVFISGGAGGVGTFAIQIAQALGAEVATTASARGEALVRRLGASVVVDYTTQRFEEVLRGYDGAFDLVGQDTLARCFDAVKPGARVVSIAGVPEPRTARQDLRRGAGLALLFWFASIGVRARASRRGVDYRYLFMHESGAELAEIAQLVDDGKIEVVLDSVYDFDRIAEAFEHLEAGRAKGKIVVRL